MQYFFHSYLQIKVFLKFIRNKYSLTANRRTHGREQRLVLGQYLLFYTLIVSII